MPEAANFAPYFAFAHVHSKRSASGEELLLARVVSQSGKIGYGFSLRLDATEARHMAERNAGVRQDGTGTVPIPPEIEAACASIQWLPEEERWAR
jgi:hypothetical protein